MDNHWPLFGLRLVHRDVVLRPMREQDLPELAAVLPGDVGHDPRLAMWPSQSFAENERRLFRQGYWKAYGTWEPASWVLHFAVSYGGRLAGVQTLEGENFPALRTVDTASWLVPEVRGRGVGVAMRAAVLGFAFGSLGAAAAISSAATSNAASLGVSRHLGYADNGVSRIVDTTGDVVQLRHFRLTAERWRGAEVTVSGFYPCRPWFGMTE
ncbi:GNAT family N-acetyltransferase [Paractinoplanes atraurantiacus]|uniref:Protein N-acetyltransferase, RimJ/RimL family n=1 Tax=Paractinoplanes atraurantiacus TaxID=1036182 RepID=A0A285HY80_9ACTN|nr:GNAT family protein [Actinoplanes atraurantiacus]SNY40597.1 Protein N-acetyltransferase, RimJ/RimL family [Actinoplanes atraurantiacus]